VRCVPDTALCAVCPWYCTMCGVSLILHYVRCVPDTALCVACPWYCTMCGVSLILHYVRSVPDTALCAARPWYCTMCGVSLILHYVRCVLDTALCAVCPWYCTMCGVSLILLDSFSEISHSAYCCYHVFFTDFAFVSFLLKLCTSFEPSALTSSRSANRRFFVCASHALPPNVTVQSVSFLLRILEVLASYLGPVTSRLSWQSFSGSPSSARQMWSETANYSNTKFFHLF
jgi:hypothetical protein